jgi:hypothetical protein
MTSPPNRQIAKRMGAIELKDRSSWKFRGDPP